MSPHQVYDIHLALQPRSFSLREHSRLCIEITQHYGTIFRCITHTYVPVAPLWIETFLSWTLTPPAPPPPPPPPPPPAQLQHGMNHPGIISLGGCRYVSLFLDLSVHTLTSFTLRLYEVVPLWGTQSVFPGVSHKTASSFNENWVTGTSDTTGWAACCWPEYRTPTAMLAFRMNSAFTANQSLVHMFHSKLKPLYTLSIYKHIFHEHMHTPSYFIIPATCFGCEQSSWGSPSNCK